MSPLLPSSSSRGPLTNYFAPVLGVWDCSRCLLVALRRVTLLSCWAPRLVAWCDASTRTEMQVGTWTDSPDEQWHEARLGLEDNAVNVLEEYSVS